MDSTSISGFVALAAVMFGLSRDIKRDIARRIDDFRAEMREIARPDLDARPRISKRTDTSCAEMLEIRRTCTEIRSEMLEMRRLRTEMRAETWKMRRTRTDMRKMCRR